MVGSFMPLLYPLALFLLELLSSTEADCHSQPQHSYLGNPEKIPTCTLQSTSNANQPGTWLVLHHILGALGYQSLEQTCPLLLQSHRQWPFVQTSREKGACCTGLLQEDCSLPGIPRLMAKSLSPLAQEKLPGGKE